MKTTFDLSQLLLRRAKAAAARQGRPLRDLVAEAIEDKLQALASEPPPPPQPVRLRGRGPLTIGEIERAIRAGRE